jgi:hypothetical protein
MDQVRGRFRDRRTPGCTRCRAETGPHLEIGHPEVDGEESRVDTVSRAARNVGKAPAWQLVLRKCVVECVDRHLAEGGVAGQLG